MAREASTLSGRVIDAEGRPVVGATVLPYFAFDRPVPGLPSATTDAEGRFEVDNLGVYKWPSGEAVPTSFEVLHPDLSRDPGQGELTAGGGRRHAARRLCSDGDRDRRDHGSTRRGSRHHGPAGRRMG